MPQLVLDLRYCSHCEQGVEMGESMSLFVRWDCQFSLVFFAAIETRFLELFLTSGPPLHCDSHRLTAVVSLCFP